MLVPEPELPALPEVEAVPDVVLDPLSVPLPLDALDWWLDVVLDPLPAAVLEPLPHPVLDPAFEVLEPPVDVVLDPAPASFASADAVVALSGWVVVLAPVFERVLKLPVP